MTTTTPERNYSAVEVLPRWADGVLVEHARNSLASTLLLQAWRDGYFIYEMTESQRPGDPLFSEHFLFCIDALAAKQA